MAEVDVFNGSKILIRIGDGATPTEAFAHPCLINSSRSVQESATTVDSVVPDCADPDAPAWTQREKDALSVTITGEGLVNKADVAAYQAWLRQAANKNVQYTVDDNTTNMQGAFHLTEFQVSGERKEKAQVSITLVSDGAVTTV